VHSGVTDGRQWEAVSRLVSPRSTVIRYDRRGYGRSKTTKTGRYAPAYDLLELLDGLKLDRVAACGNSAGALAVLEAAALAPERFGRLLLLAPPLPDWEDWSERAETYDEAETAALAAGDLDRAIELNLDMWVHREEHRGPVAEMLRAAFENQRRKPWEEIEMDPPVTQRLDAVRGPVHLMVGEHDLPEFRAMAWHLADRIPGAKAEEIPGAGHLLGLEAPEIVAAAI
jgi:pimeloyl-ACP methyl ester carboxylesterase